MKYSSKNCMRLVSLAIAAAMALATTPTFAADPAIQMGSSKPMAATAGYSFELAGPPQSGGAGKSIVAVKLLHDGKPVTDAVVTQTRADMGPMGMAAMTAPVTSMGEGPPGTYRFEVDNGPVWKNPTIGRSASAPKCKGSPKP